jgi:hypothetical protein
MSISALPLESKKSQILGATSVYLLPTAVLLIALWLPFGFSMMGLIEEWDLLGLFTINGPFLTVHFGGPLLQHILRPLVPLSFGTAYLLDRDSFHGWHLMMMAALLVKGAAMTHLVGHATNSYKYGVMAAVLLLIYPADTMQLSFRSLSINWSSAYSLLGAAFLYSSFDVVSRSRRYLCGSVGFLLFLAACLIYEVAATAVILPLAFLLIERGIRAGFHQFYSDAGLAVLCLLAPFAYAAYAFSAATWVPTYQAALLPSAGNIFFVLAGALPKLFSVGAVRALFGGWIDAIRILATEYSSYGYLLAAAILIAALSSSFAFVPKAPAQLSAADADRAKAQSLRLIAVGFLVMLLGYAPFLVSAAHLAVTQRTFIAATPGAVLVWIGALTLLARFIRLEIAFSVMAVLGFSGQLFQFHHYVNISDRQRSILREIAEKFDGNLGNRTLVLVDGTNSAGSTWIFLGDGLVYTLSYLYGHWVGPIEICHQGAMEWQRVDGLGRQGTCIEDETSWTFRHPPPVSGPGYVAPSALPDRKLNKSDVIVVSVGPHGAQGDVPPSPYRSSLENGSDAIARRYRGILKTAPWSLSSGMFRDQIVEDHYKWSFGNYWNMDIPTRGSGWRETEWLVKPWRQSAFAWKTSEDSYLYFDFIPKDARYHFTARFDDDMGLLKKLRVQLNGRDLSLHWLSEKEVEAEIPSHVLRAGENSLNIQAPTNPNYFGLSVRLMSVEIQEK